MPTYEKYLQHRKSQKNVKTLVVDLQQLANEYSKLLDKKFFYVFSGGACIEFQFKMENFYHLLGFHKLTDVTVVKMVENNKLKKEDFYKYVRDGRIRVDSTDANIIGTTEEKIVHLQDTKEKSAYGEINAHRFQYFSEKKVLDLLRNDPVIDFEKDDCDTVIDADKIFFELISDFGRNLNLFIGFNAMEKRHYVSTFFVEMEKEKFKRTKTGDLQPLLKILSRKVTDTKTNKTIDFFVKWDNARQEYINEPFYRGQNRLKVWINSKHILSAQVVSEIRVQCNLIEQYQNELKNLELLMDVTGAIACLDIPEEKENAQLKLMEYDIDADNPDQIQLYKKYDFVQVRNDKLKLDDKLTALKNKLSKHEKHLPDIIELEIREVMDVYRPYLPHVQFEREKVCKLLEANRVFEQVLFPEELEKLYYKAN